LLCYFEEKPETKFVDIGFYKNIIDESEHQVLEGFFMKIGVSKLPRILKKEITDHTTKNKFNLSSSTQDIHVYDKYLDGCEELLNNIGRQKSILLWKQLLSLIENETFFNFRRLIQGEHKYFYYRDCIEEFDSTEYKRLVQSKWIYNKNGEVIAPKEANIDDLSDEYDKKSEIAKSLIDFLGIKSNAEKQKAADILELSLAEIQEYKKNKEIFLEWLENKRKAADRTAKFPQKSISNLGKRIDSMAEKYTDSDEKQYEKVERDIRKSSPFLEEKRNYLEHCYTNDAAKMFCQICKKEMPFKKPSGKYYFEIREISINTKNEKSEITKETTEPYLALCPICAAKYKVFVQTNPEEMSNICTQIKETPCPTNDENTDIPILLDKKETITFVVPHLSDLQTILKKEVK